MYAIVLLIRNLAWWASKLKTLIKVTFFNKYHFLRLTFLEFQTEIGTCM